MSNDENPGGSGRKRISDENLHLSSFDIVRREPGTVLLIKATDAHPLAFRRGLLLLPATMLQFGEQPSAAAKRALATQLSGAEGLEPKFAVLESFIGSHWDICAVFNFDASAAGTITTKPPYAEAAFYRLDSLPRAKVAADHLEVIDGVVPADSSK